MRRAWAVVVVVAAVSGGAAVLANRDLPQQEATQGQVGVPRLQRHQNDDENAPMDARTAGWVAASYGLLQAQQCETQRWTTEEECRAAQRVPQWEMQVWATPAGSGRFVAQLPDGSLARRGGYGGVLLLDPFPAASWGHPLLLLLVADNTSQIHCTRTAGHWLGESLSLPPAGAGGLPHVQPLHTYRSRPHSYRAGYVRRRRLRLRRWCRLASLVMSPTPPPSTTTNTNTNIYQPPQFPR